MPGQGARRFMKNPRISASLLFAVLAATGPAAAQGIYDATFENRYDDFENRQTLNTFSGVAIDAGQYDQALSTLEQIIFTDPNDIPARVSIARIYYHVGSFDLALGHVNEALALGRGTSFENEIIELKRLIEKAESGVNAYIDVTGGIGYNWLQSESTLVPQTSGSGFGAFAYLDGLVEFDLQTASRDVLTLSGGASYVRGYADLDFDSNYESFDVGGGYGAITLSKGLPDLIDTLRVDLSAYGEISDLGADRIVQELGVRTRSNIRPSVETQLYVDLNYAWLGSSDGIFADNEYSYGLGVQQRLSPGWTAALYLGRSHRDGSVPAMPMGAGLSYDVASTEVEGSLTHLVHVFDDGRSWFQRISGGYVDGDILDYSTVGGLAPSTISREQWMLDWDHTVQMSTNSQVQLGAGYRHTTLGENGVNRTKTDAFNIRALYTYRFQ